MGHEVGFPVAVIISDVADRFVLQQGDRIRNGRKIAVALIDEQMRARNKISKAVRIEIALQHSGRAGDWHAALKRAVAVA
jgi:hypothetical protein